MTTPDEHRRNAIEKAAQALFANDGLWDVSLDAHKAPHRARAERAVDAALPDLRRAFAEQAAAAIYTLPYLAELPTPDLENEVKVVSRPDVVRLVREIGGIA